MKNDDIASILEEIGMLLELKGENPFKVRAYENAARAIQALTEPVERLLIEKRLSAVKGIGESIQKKIEELVTTGRLAYYEELKSSIPPGLVEMLNIPGLGPKKVKALYEKLGVDSIDKLEAVCTSGKVANLDGFGEKTQIKILQGIAFRRQYASKHLLIAAQAVAHPIYSKLKQHPDVIQCSLAGSVRRWKEIIGDIDFLVSSKKPLKVIEFFTKLDSVQNIIARGETKAAVILQGGIQADLRVITESEYPFALAYFTGSKEHNIVMRQRAIDRGLRLNEYGLFKSTEETRDPALLLPCSSEEDIYSKLGLCYIPPELREDRGEFDAAEKGKIPELIDEKALKGSLHNHSNWSDGADDLMSIAMHMAKLGLQYWAITDHSKSSPQANGLDSDKLKKQFIEIKLINEKLKAKGFEFELLTGVEVDILPGGKLDIEDEVLAMADVVVASLHSGFSQDEKEITNRIISAVKNPFVHILGHPTGRLLLEREPYKVDIKAVIDACSETGTWIELNAHPSRLDLDWRYWSYAKSKGVKCVINCDAHNLNHVEFLRLGAGIARKGWLTAADVINTQPLSKLKKLLKSKRS
jgi:DNA polymerase (family 10)